MISSACRSAPRASSSSAVVSSVSRWPKLWYRWVLRSRSSRWLTTSSLLLTRKSLRLFAQNSRSVVSPSSQVQLSRRSKTAQASSQQSSRMAVSSKVRRLFSRSVVCLISKVSVRSNSKSSVVASRSTSTWRPASRASMLLVTSMV